ncbi:probable ubiquitin carboxyl-terminal hydrolase FAF isoform X3 [Chironomus tepperi]|uniref:probable ubiquitin carboxyl-terminal hydrolase FAF isoform X3 n=1 Tax=Chironomus tepperi TaxID=113505 RepID=UPI00391F3DB7
MTYDTRSSGVRSTTDASTENQQQANQQQTEATTSEQNELSPEDLIANFPVAKLHSLNSKINSPRWVVPVLPDQELECLLNYAIKLSQAGVDYECEPCVRFYRDGLTVSFTKILTDDAVSSWKLNIHNNILMLCGKLLHLCALHMKIDNSCLLDLLAIVLDADNKFHTHNAARQSELFSVQGASVEGLWGTLLDNQTFAKSPTEPRQARGWLVDLINRFGQFGGFDNFLERFNSGIALMIKNKSPTTTEELADIPQTSSGCTSSISLSEEASKMKTSTISSSGTNSTSTSLLLEENSKLTLPVIHLLLRPFAQCHELLTQKTIEKYFQPIWEPLIEILDNLSDDELKRDAKLEGKNDLVNGIIKSSRLLMSHSPNAENLIKDLEMCRLKIILRVLQISSFNGKMNALNEINKLLSYVCYYPHRQQSDDEVDTLTAEKMAKWIKETDVLGIVLKDSLHQPQYVEKLEKILRFLIKEKTLTLDDLAAVWRSQAGKHEAIVKNVHDLLAKLAWDFNAEQLDYLFECFQTSMKTANKKQRERLLELNRRLAEDDKNGVMADKVLKLFWSLAHSPEVPPEVLDQALASHVKILDYSCSQDKDAQKPIWLNKCVEELKSNDDWVLPALRLIREICCLYEPTPNHVPRIHSMSNRQHVIDRLQNEHMLVILVTNSLTKYMEKIRELVRTNKNLKPMEIMLDKRYPHPQQIQERLDFLKFLLKDGQLWLCADQAKQIWQCLAVNAAFQSDREECFRWFGKLMGDEPDLDPGINKEFFENNILQLDPQLLTESGIKCFERFFKAVNSKEEKLKAKHRGYVLDDEDLIGKDYLWRVITLSGDEIAYKAIELLKEVSTALGPRLQENIAEFHENFISDCCDKIRISYDRILMIKKAIEESTKEHKELEARKIMEADVICRILRVMHEYIKECDRVFTGERMCLSLSRASRGKHICLFIRFQTNGRQLDDIEVTTHTNETVISFKRNLLKRLKGTSINNIKIDLFNNNGELIEISDDRHPLSMYNIRDKTVINVKLSPLGTALASSPDSSSSTSSTGSPPRPCLDLQRTESEATLPGVIISTKHQYTEFFLQLHQLGSELQHNNLRECARTLLHLLPLDSLTVSQINQMCINKFFGIGEKSDNQMSDGLLPESLFLSPDAAHVLYNLEVLQALLMPALDPHSDSTMRLQLAWLHSGVAHFILDLLTKNNFMPKADVYCKRAAYQCVLKLVKLFLFIMGYVLSRVGDEPLPIDGIRTQVEILKQTLSTIVCNSDHTMRAIASKLAQNISDEMLSESPEGENCRTLFASALQWSLPDVATLKSLVHLSWAASTSSFHLLTSPSELGNENGLPEALDFAVCKEALEVLCFGLVLNHNGYEALSRDPNWSNFITSLVLINGSRHIRQTASEQIFYMCTYCSSDKRPFIFMVKLLIEILKTKVTAYSATCSEFFQLFCRVLRFGCSYSWPLKTCDNLLMQEIEWIRSIRDNVKLTGETGVHDDLLEGRLNLTKDLMSYLSFEVKPQLSNLIVEIVDDFIFPASKQYLYYRRKGHLPDLNAPPPVCRNPHTISAACDLLVALCTNSVPNMKLLVNTLLDMFCFEVEPLQEWEYLPAVGPRPKGGFCGLKNAGATCYMNSVLQQLFMVPSLRLGILGASGACNDPNEDFSGEMDNRSAGNEEDNSGRKNYNVGILKHVQAIFAHLSHSTLQFYIPRGLWTHFKLQGEPVNLREQQDAVEFFMSLFESLDEGLKALGHSQLMGATLGGLFSDQKICQECPHRYSKEEPFSAFSIDIRNHSSLTDSLEQYVKGELLEGADAYHCDKCDKKVVTVKRTCVRKLPPVLAIQLKRFEYDYERVCAIKFNDYFEFPRFLDMEPYTVSGLAKMEGEIVELEEGEEESQPTKYQLTGIVVHSGQASGGHYYSYILHKNENGAEQWYKFDDGEVSECKMHEDEELKAQCFGGDYMGEVYDNNLKRMQFRRQKRWWNAYMLFYTRIDHNQTVYKPCIEQLSLAESKNCILPMPAPIEKSLRFQNIRFLHARSLFSSEFFSFIRNLVSCSIPARIEKITSTTEELSLLSIQLASQFLFQFGFKTKKTLRGAAIEWFEAISPHIRHSVLVRRWFAQNALLSPPNRLAEYILVASSLDIRTIFVKIVVFFCHFASQDEPLPNYDGSNLCEQVLHAVLKLLILEASDYGKHLPHFFSLFLTYAGLGVHERHQLLKLNVPAIFMKVALDEGPGPPIKYQYPELQKLHQCVSILVRSSDISSRCQSSSRDIPIKPNIYVDPKVPYDQLLPLTGEAEELLLNRTSYIKKLIEDTNVGEEGIKLLQYCSWENPQFSQALLTELLWHCGFAYWHDMRHHTDLLLHILLIEDSWQHHRIHNALIDREGLLETIQRNRLNYQKRAYQCIKCLVHLFRKSPVALNMLHGNPTIAQAWSHAVEWLHDELERQRGVASQYNYSSWSPPAQSNENTNSFVLERSQSAKNILQMAFELCPEEEQEEPNDSEVEANEEYPQQPNTKVSKEITNEIVSNSPSVVSTEPQSSNIEVATDEDALNRITEKLGTMKIHKTRQVQDSEVESSSTMSSATILENDLPDTVNEIGKIVNSTIQPTNTVQSGVVNQEQKS